MLSKPYLVEVAIFEYAFRIGTRLMTKVQSDTNKYELGIEEACRCQFFDTDIRK